jgi:hypothetical protein
VAEVDAEEEKDEQRIFHRISGGGVEVCPAGLSLHDDGSLLFDFDGAVVMVVEDAGAVSHCFFVAGRAGCLEEAVGSEVGPERRSP